jgi:hypothetical protein
VTVEQSNKPSKHYITSLNVHLLMDALVKVLGPEQWADRKYGLLEDAQAMLVHLHDDAHHALVDVWEESETRRSELNKLALARQAKQREMVQAIDKLLSAHSRSPLPATNNRMVGVELGEFYCMGCVVGVDHVTISAPYPCYINRILTEALDAR